MSDISSSIFAETWRKAADAFDPPAGNLKYASDPVGWVEQRLGEFLWSKQREIAESVRDHRRTAVRSCHTVGKSYLAARIAAWWIESHPIGEAFVVTTAPTGRQVRAVLWREIGRAHGKGNLTGWTNQTEWWVSKIVNGKTKSEMVAFGQKPSDVDPTAFHGIHAPYVLVILDEACGIPRILWEAADTLISNEDSRIFVVGNPDDPVTEFFEVCKPGSGWNVIGISAFDTPNFTGEAIPPKLAKMLIGTTWVEEKKKRWGETNPMYLSKILGQFPMSSADGLIPMAWMRAAIERDLPPTMPVELGVDVGGGGDKSVTAARRGPHVRIVRKDQNPDTMQTLGGVIESLRATGASVARVDNIGIGHGAVDRAAEIADDQSETAERRNLATKVVGVNVGESASDKERFVNLRAEGYWALRERFESGDIDIDHDDEDLQAQLVDIKYKRNSRGQIQIESKDDIKGRGRPSPDEADAVMLSFLKTTESKKRGPRVWGRRRGRRSS